MDRLDLIDMRDISALCHVRYQTVRMWRLRGKLPQPDYVVGMSPTWLRSTILRWMAEQAERSTA